MLIKTGLIAISALLLSACGGPNLPLVTNGDLTKHLESTGYTKVLIRQKISCGKAGSGRYFIATRAGKPVTGQICYTKNNGEAKYTVDELKAS